ncbi:MAG TPA: aldo/keto reductase, partial [Polyangiaceae bacterium]
VTRGIDEACARLGTDWLDVFHLHSCPLEVLRSDGVLGALDDARRAGKLRVAAYSGDGEALAWAAASDHFGSVQCSVNLFDQGALAASVPAAAARSAGVLAKRALGNAPWRFAARPAAHDVATYWDRMHSLALDLGPAGWDDTALRFAAFAPGVRAALVGTTSEAHLRAAAAIVERGPLPSDVTAAIRARWNDVGRDWPGVI